MSHVPGHRGVGDASTVFGGLGLLLGLSAIAMGAAVAYGVLVEAPRERKYAKRKVTSSRAYMRKNGARKTKHDRAIEAEEDRLGATALQERFNAGEFDDTAKRYKDAEDELTRLYDLARENVRLASAKRAAPKNYRTLSWTQKGKSAYLHGKDGVPLASICPSGDFSWKAYVVRADRDTLLGDFLSREAAETAAGKAATQEAAARRKDVSRIPTRAIEDHYRPPAPPAYRLALTHELRPRR